MRAKSFRQAALALNMPNSTLSRRISALEKTIGLRLLYRTTRKVEPTEAGQLYYERCKRIMGEVRLAHEQLDDMLTLPSGLLRLSLPADFAAGPLAPILSEFAEQYPGITFDLDLTPRRADLVSEPVDAAIRMGFQPDSNLIARQIGTVSASLYASPRYLERFGEPMQPEDLSSHECIRMNVAAMATSWTLINGDAKTTVAVDGKFLINSMGMIRSLAIHGAGIARLPDMLAKDELAKGSLQRILPDWKGAATPVYVLTETRMLPAKTQRFIEFLQLHCQRALDM